MFAIFGYFFLLLFAILSVIFLFRLFLYRAAFIYGLKKWWHWIEDRVHVHQSLRVPKLNENSQENQFYGVVCAYVSSLTSIEDSDFTNLFSGKKSSDIVLCLDDNQTVHDEFLGARVSWTNEVRVGRGNDRSCSRSFVLRIKKKDKRRILKAYIQHIHTVSDEIEERRGEVKLYMNTLPHHEGNGRWISVPFTHPSTLDTIVMDSDLKNKVKSDLESFLKSKQYYHRLGRVWKRSYLLCGPSGTGKSSFVAAVANFLSYDVYDIDLSKVSDDSDLKMLLLQTKNKSVIVVEDLDRSMAQKSTTISLSGVLNFMDGIVNSCCGDERVLVFTMNSKDQIDPLLLRPGRIDVHIHFPLCDFNSFKSLANSYLGLKDHKLFPQVAEVFQSGAALSPAEIGEIMLAHRSSPSRALKSVITALQINVEARRPSARRSGETSSSRPSADDACVLGGVGGKDSVTPAKEFRKLYGLLRLRSCSKIGPSDYEA
ncbi:hypothetical protein NMG60_11028874 [Bertholletia excelsa]